MAVQTYWNDVSTKVDAPNNAELLKLSKDAWDSIGKGLGDIGTKLIEDPMTKQYLHDLNQGKDVSGYDPRVVAQDILKNTSTIQGRLLENEKTAFDNYKTQRNYNFMESASQDLLKAKALADSGRTEEARAAVDNILKTYGGNIEAIYQYLPNIFDVDYKKQELALKDKQIGVQASLGAQRNALLKAGVDSQALDDGIANFSAQFVSGYGLDPKGFDYLKGKEIILRDGTRIPVDETNIGIIKNHIKKNYPGIPMVESLGSNNSNNRPPKTTDKSKEDKDGIKSIFS